MTKDRPFEGTSAAGVPTTTGAAASVGARVTIVARPGPARSVTACVLSCFLVIMGTVHIVDAFARMGESYWWLRLAQGVIELLLGGWTHGDHLRSLCVLINLAGAFALVWGIGALNTGFGLRRVHESVRAVTL